MRTKRQRLAAVTLIGGLTTLGIGLTAGAASANVNDCSGYLGNAQSGSLHLTGNPAANSSVPAGSSISLDASWTKTDFNETDRLFVCGSVDGVFSPAMSAEDKGVGNEGSASASTTVPAGTAAGSNVCVVSVLRGQFPTTPVSQGEMVSDTLCYTAAAAVTTTTMAPTTTTTVAPAVEPTVDPVNTGAGDTSAPAAPAPAVSGEVAAAPAPMPVLPRTGSGIDVLAGFGGAALALGGLGRFLGRKRSAEA
jgi:hypothetical protein